MSAVMSYGMKRGGERESIEGLKERNEMENNKGRMRARIDDDN